MTLKKTTIAKESASHRWVFFVTLFLGFWLLCTPITMGITQSQILLGDQICALLMILASCSSLKGCKFSPWILALIGTYLQFAPLIFWAKESVAYLNDTVTGILCIAFALIIPGTPGILDPEEGEIPEGWSYNPSSWVQRFPILVLGSIGWFAARLMAAYQLGYIDTIWDPFFVNGTESVISSNLSKSFPVSDAGLGAFAYSLEVLLGLKGHSARWRTMPWLVVGFSFLVVPLGLTSIVLVILQPILVGAWCSYCLLAAFCMLLMCMFTLDEVVAVSQLLIKAFKENHFWRVFFYGSHPANVKNDPQTPKFPPAPKEFFVEMCRGVSFPPRLVGAALLGAFFMLAPYQFAFEGMMADFAHTFGALIIVISILSFAEVARIVRKINHVLALVLLIASFYGDIDLLPKLILMLMAIGVSLLSLHAGKIQEDF